MINTKTSKELLKELIENYNYNGIVCDINKDFVSGFDAILDAIDNGSVFRYTLDAISFCGAKGKNSVKIVLKGAMGGIFNKNDKFTVVFSDEDKSVCVISHYLHTEFNWDYGTMFSDFITGLIDFNHKVSVMKDEMAGNFEKIANTVNDIIKDTEFKIKWCNTDNSLIMIADKDCNEFFLLRGECMHKGEIEVVGKPCGPFDWGVVDRNFKGDNAHTGFDLFMATNNFCKEICAS